MDLPEESSSSAGGGAGGGCRRRRTCTAGCGRPINVCLCHTLPSAPVPTATQVVILHHPHERRHKLATVPVLAKCLRNCNIIVGRKLKYGQSELLDSLHDQASENPNLPLGRAVYLFPGMIAKIKLKRFFRFLLFALSFELLQLNIVCTSCFTVVPYFVESCIA